MAQAQSLYKKVGGEEAVAKLVIIFTRNWS
jgi:truncated hemoglobin YjbI